MSEGAWSLCTLSGMPAEKAVWLGYHRPGCALVLCLYGCYECRDREVCAAVGTMNLKTIRIPGDFVQDTEV